MGKNIILVSGYDKFVREQAKKIADEKNILFADVDAILEYNIQDEYEVLNKCGLTYLNKLKDKTMKDIAGYENTFIYFPLNLYINNNNFEIFKDCGKILFVEPNNELLYSLYKNDNSISEDEKKVQLSAYNIRSKLAKLNSNSYLCLDYFESDYIYNQLKRAIDNI